MNRQGSLRGSSLRVRREIGQSECPIDEVKKVSKDRKRSTVSNAASGEGRRALGVVGRSMVAGTGGLDKSSLGVGGR